MEEFHLQQIEILEGEISKLRSLMNDVSGMREKCHELELSSAALYNPEVMDKFWEAETVLKETEAQCKALLDNAEEEDSNPVIKLECPETENETSDFLENTIESCEGRNEVESHSTSDVQADNP